MNVIVSEAAENAGREPFGYLEFSLVGLPLLAGTLAIMALAGPRLLPRRTPKALPADLGAHAAHADGAVPARGRRRPARGDARLAAGRLAAGGAGPPAGTSA